MSEFEWTSIVEDVVGDWTFNVFQYSVLVPRGFNRGVYVANEWILWVLGGFLLAMYALDGITLHQVVSFHQTNLILLLFSLKFTFFLLD